MWMSSLSLEDKSVPYYRQKEMECLEIEQAQALTSSQLIAEQVGPKKRGPRAKPELQKARIQK